METLGSYGIDRQTGFVPAVEPLRRLPAAFDLWEEIIADMSSLIRTRQLRPRLVRLPLIDIAELADERARERAMLILTMFANGWVWGGSEPHLRIPAQIAVPLSALAGFLDRPPIVHYASMLLNNWRKLDPLQMVSADNARMQVQFLGGVDEDWFFIASLGVELAGAPLLPITHEAVSGEPDDASLAQLLHHLAEAMGPVIAALERMREWCDPHIFYHRIRPYLAGWPSPGVIYEGVAETPQLYVGGSAAQSSLIQALDALLGIAHENGRTGAYLLGMRHYMPQGHRRFVADVERLSPVRRRAEAGPAGLRRAYNEAIEQVDIFRRRHIGLAHDYIARPSGLAADERGTGGTEFIDFLRDARSETAASRLES
jgi:indoleamine 2,3-dioxygenase